MEMIEDVFIFNEEPIAIGNTSFKKEKESYDVNNPGEKWKSNPEFFSVRNSLDRASSEDLIVEYPEVNELQIDLDTYEAYLECLKRISWIQEFYHDSYFTVNKSKSDNWHIRVYLFEKNGSKVHLNNMERIALQSILNSDFKKEFISYMRMTNGESDPILLFEKPGYQKFEYTSAKKARVQELGV